jgi:uncharacterized membrane protein
LEAFLLDWLNLLLRWAHLVVGIAWIGASFYFIWLDNHLEKTGDARLAGELWAVHGGGFYRVEKFAGAPPALPATLHWFKWEAYWTWITGFALLIVHVYANAELYLIDPAVMPLSKWAAIGIGLGFLVASLAVYEGICRSPLGRNDLYLSISLFVFASLLAWGLAQVFSGRGAFIHFGAALGTIMAGNVGHVIIPGQRRMVQAMSEGRAPDPRDGRMGKQRSVHNTYFTLPVIFTMVAGHYPMTFGHRWAWVVLVALTLAGALIRTWFVMRHKGNAPAWVLVAGLVFVAFPAFLVLPRSTGNSEKINFSEIQSIIEKRCVACHADKPSFPGMAEAPKGAKLDTPERIRAQGALIHQQTVLTNAMPPGNLTAMTPGEREALARWYRSGMR